MEDMGYSVLQKKVLVLTGIDLQSYKPEQMTRRLGTLMARFNAPNFVALSRIIETDPKCLSQFLDHITINVSEFFRDPLRFSELRETVLPGLLKERPSLRVWSAGCSNGSEPYTLAMILKELTPKTRHYVLATDVDATILKRAKDANQYIANDVKDVAPQLLSKYFVRNGEFYAVANELKSCVEFRQHDLLTEPLWSNFDLITCRNVVIYFKDDVKNRVFERLSNSLRQGGVLFIGGTETVRKPNEMGLESIRYSFYRKVAK